VTVQRCIGLLGLPASGKSTVARWLADRGCHVLDADRLAHAAYRDPAVQARVRDELGIDVLDAGGEFDPTRLASVVFRDAATRRRLEQIIHPIVRERLQEALATTAAEIVVLDVPLLAEGTLGALCDLFLAVTCDPATRQARARDRGWAPEELARRDAAQLSLEEKLAAVAPHGPVIQVANDGDLEDLAQALETHWPRICHHAT
jgi:dephospho-CoA kinase